MSIFFFRNILMFWVKLAFSFIYSAIFFCAKYKKISIQIRFRTFVRFKFWFLSFLSRQCCLVLFRTCCHIFLFFFVNVSVLCRAIHDLFLFLLLLLFDVVMCSVLHTRKCSYFIWVFVGFVFRTKKMVSIEILCFFSYYFWCFSILCVFFKIV